MSNLEVFDILPLCALLLIVRRFAYFIEIGDGCELIPQALHDILELSEFVSVALPLSLDDACSQCCGGILNVEKMFLVNWKVIEFLPMHSKSFESRNPLLSMSN